MDDMSTKLDQGKWQPLDLSKKKDFKEYHVSRGHKQVDATTFRYIVENDDSDKSLTVVIEFAVKDKDPLKNINNVELRIKDDKVVGIDLDGDCFQLIGH